MFFLPSLAIFVATRAEQVPPGVTRFISVDGSVPGASLRWDHHLTGERINLDAMPELIDTTGFDGVGTTLADADALASVVAVLLGGKSQIPGSYRAILEGASHWCDHLAPHPDLDEATSRLARGFLDAVDAQFSQEDPSASFRDACLRTATQIRDGLPLPFSDRWPKQQRIAGQLDLAGKVIRGPHVALVDLRGAPPVDPLAVYQLHTCPVAVSIEAHPRGGLRYTVGVNPSVPDRPSDITPALRALAAAEFLHGAPCLGPDPLPGNENWGGRATVFGSPWNYPSRLPPEQVVSACSLAMWGV